VSPKPKIIVLGAGGHARVLVDALRQIGVEFLGATVADETDEGPGGIPILGTDDVILNYPPEAVLLANGIGSIGDPSVRRDQFDHFSTKGYRFATVVHPKATLADDVQLGEGCVVMAGAIIQTGSRIGDNTIINTGAIVDHDGHIGSHVHLAPGAVLSGGVSIGHGVHVGTGATVIQAITIGANAIVGAGAVVVKDVRPGAVVLGVPARE
jgi:UDP-perosamine 4-acetyltransferase